MSAPAAACIVIINQQREQTIQHHHEQCDRAAIAQCKVLANNCTIVENGQVVVKPIQLPVDASPES